MCSMSKNEFKVIFGSCSENESFARMVISAFVARMDPDPGGTGRY